MKKITIFSIGLLLWFSTSCKESFLEETPSAFLSTNNAFKTVDDFNASVNNLYGSVRAEFYSRSDWQPMQYLYRTDLGIEVTVGGNPNLSAEFGPNGTLANNHWSQIYKIVADANTIISRIPASALSERDRVSFEAKARFFRAMAYRSLAYLFGGVPLITEEIIAEKVDFVRATKKEVLTQVIEDLKFAAANLPGITTVRDGEISNLAAYHLLSEVYLADGQFKNAADAATVVIDDPNTGLMTSRFGSRSTVNPGDVYWDLFQTNNQNRKSANNREAIWVIQFESDVPGGGATSTGMAGSYQLERVHVPLFRDMRINGVQLFLWPVGDYTGGRGVGFLQPSRYFADSVWKSDFNNDIRNANHNFVREVVATNPASPFFGKVISTKNPPAGANISYPSRVFYPYQSKATTPFNHPAGLYVNPGSSDPIRKFELKSSAGGTYADIAIDADGNLLVVDSGNNRIQKFTPQGDFLYMWGQGGAAGGMFNNPQQIAVTSEGVVFIADSGNHRVQKFLPRKKNLLNTQAPIVGPTRPVFQQDDRPGDPGSLPPAQGVPESTDQGGGGVLQPDASGEI